MNEEDNRQEIPYNVCRNYPAKISGELMRELRKIQEDFYKKNGIRITLPQASRIYVENIRKWVKV